MLVREEGRREVAEVGGLRGRVSKMSRVSGE